MSSASSARLCLVSGDVTGESLSFKEVSLFVNHFSRYVLILDACVPVCEASTLSLTLLFKKRPSASCMYKSLKIVRH
jgi:hypothetical protein